MNNKKLTRAAALIAALLLLATSLGGLFSMTAYAAGAYTDSSLTIYTDVNKEYEISRKLASRDKYTLEFKVRVADGYQIASLNNTNNKVTFELTGGGFSKKYESITVANDDRTLIFTIKNAVFNGSQDRASPFKISGISFLSNSGGTAISEILVADFSIDSKYYKDSSSSGGDDDPQLWTPDIVVDKVTARDSKGDVIDFLDKDSVVGKLEIVFTDFGLLYEDVEDMNEEDFTGYLVSESGFTSSVNNKGQLRLINPDKSDGFDYARFRLTFSNIRWDGSATSLRFRTQYYMWNGERVAGNGTATIPQAKVGDDSSGVAPPTPFIIISQYNYGKDYIQAGQEFPLDISFKNTSSDIPLENIVMTITPPEDLTIATASNSVYIDALKAGGSMGHQIRLQAKAGAAVGSKSVEIKFAYEYLVDKKREKGETTEKIAIPITQIDRFEVDPITDLPEIMEVGENYYFTLNFINRGKSTVYNVSGVNTFGEAVPDTQHFGNVEAGKTGSLEFTLVPSTAGEFSGEIVLQYENENMVTNHITLPYNVTVEEAWMPPVDPEPVDPGMGEENKSINWLQLSLCTVGGLLIAGPLALYIIKRIKAKGNEEDLDEDF
ncbi:hypothetical protein U6B65_12430 [Oscillospiraceae bacterium MB08-C2-2]|nr:hypothetical protein U6B65_12430 [Oscillospiraceae bacterium MB08-C2-2]